MRIFDILLVVLAAFSVIGIIIADGLDTQPQYGGMTAAVADNKPPHSIVVDQPSN